MSDADNKARLQRYCRRAASPTEHVSTQQRGRHTDFHSHPRGSEKSQTCLKQTVKV